MIKYLHILGSDPYQLPPLGLHCFWRASSYRGVHRSTRGRSVRRGWGLGEWGQWPLSSGWELRLFWGRETCNTPRPCNSFSHWVRAPAPAITLAPEVRALLLFSGACWSDLPPGFPWGHGLTSELFYCGSCPSLDKHVAIDSVVKKSAQADTSMCICELQFGHFFLL